MDRAALYGARAGAKDAKQVAPMVPEIHMTAERNAARSADKPVTKRE
jgi:hypothetical protein